MDDQELKSAVLQSLSLGGLHTAGGGTGEIELVIYDGATGIELVAHGDDGLVTVYASCGRRADSIAHELCAFATRQPILGWEIDCWSGDTMYEHGAFVQFDLVADDYAWLRATVTDKRAGRTAVLLLDPHQAGKLGAFVAGFGATH